MQKKSKIYIIICFCLLSIALLVSAFMLFMQHNTIKEQETEIQEVSAAMEFEKQQSIDEFENMKKQYEDYYINTDNDSLLKLIDEEKQKVDQLLQELKTVKATNRRRIAELTKELTTVRGVLKTYVEKVDSLNALNNTLRTENQQVKLKYEESNKKLEEKTAEAAALDKKVSMASILEADNIEVITLNERSKVTRSLKKTSKLQINFRILRNITTERGKKTIYLRITDSNEKTLKAVGENYFMFEGMNIEYSAQKNFDFGGESQNVSIYYPVQERLEKGNYSLTLFVDGNIIGESIFTLE
ncbi:MAG: hypothetical protein MJ010_00270 [Paludibacteraceae bacterium]|nr:hypothetical protein [Paludibacteraceae bacterium]